MVGQPACGVRPFGVGIGQRVDVDVDPRAFAHPRAALAAGDAILLRLVRQVHAECLDRDPAARGAVRRDEIEEPILGLGRQVWQQPLGQPCGRLRGVEPGVGQRRGPVVAKVDGDRNPPRLRLRSMCVQRRGLVLQHLGLVDLEHCGARGPLQSVGARVQSGRQDHHLADARPHHGTEVVVEVVGAHRLVVAGHLVQRTELVVVGEPVRITAGHLGPSRSGRSDEEIGELVADQRVVARRLDGTGGGHAQRGRADAFGDVPAVAVGTDGGGLEKISHFVSHATK